MVVIEELEPERLKKWKAVAPAQHENDIAVPTEHDMLGGVCQPQLAAH